MFYALNLPAIGIALFLLKAISPTAHIGISVVGILTLAIVHKVSAALFAALPVILLVHKLLATERKTPILTRLQKEMKTLIKRGKLC